MPVPESKWEWYGVHGHFICGRWCRFHLFTKVGDYLVSTLGEYVHPSNSGGSEATENKWLDENWPGEDIGSSGKYETLVFKAGKRCRSPGCNCLVPRLGGGNELDGVRYMTRGEAQKGHMKFCRKWAKKGKA